MSKTAATGLGSIVMVLAFTGVYLSKHHGQPNKEIIPYGELPSDVPAIIKLDALPIDESVLYNKIVRSIQNENMRETISSTKIFRVTQATPIYNGKTHTDNDTGSVIVERIKGGVLRSLIKPVQPAVQVEIISAKNLVFDIKSEIPNDVNKERREKIKEVLNSNNIADVKR